LEQRFVVPLKGKARVQFPAWVGFGRDGRYLAVAYDAGGVDSPRLVVWDATTGKVVLERELGRVNYAHPYFGLHVAFHPAGSHILTDSLLNIEGDPLGSAKNPLRARTVERGDIPRVSRRASMFTVGDREIRHLTIYPDNTLFIDTLDPDAMRYDTADLRSVKSFTAGKKYALDGPPALMAMDAGASRVAWAQRKTGDDEADVVRTLHLGTGKSRQLKSERPIQDVACLVFSPDGKEIVSGCADGFIRKWTVDDGREKWCVAVHEWTIGSAAFTQDGRLLVCGSLKNKDANLLFLDVATGKMPFVGTIEKSGVVGLAFAPGGDKLAVLAGHGTVYLYDVAELRKSVGKK
jgi:WD40 repeat protein